MYIYYIYVYIYIYIYLHIIYSYTYICVHVYMDIKYVALFQPLNEEKKHIECCESWRQIEKGKQEAIKASS